MESLRQEILEAHNARSDLLKWKLVLVSALGTIGLGLTQEKSYAIVLVGIPLVCAYVDLLTRHLTLRIHVIGHFLRDPPEDVERTPELAFFSGYERYVERRRDAFAFEEWALYLSSTMLSLGVAAYGAIQLATENETERAEEITLLVVGLLGAVVAKRIDDSYERKVELIARGASPRGSRSRGPGARGL